MKRDYNKNITQAINRIISGIEEYQTTADQIISKAEEKKSASLDSDGSVNEAPKCDLDIATAESQAQTKEEKGKPLSQTRPKKNNNLKGESENGIEQKKPDEEESDQKHNAKQASIIRPKKMNKSANLPKNSKEQKFGQPVRRENLSKDQTVGSNTPKKAIAFSPERESQRTAQRKRSGWADAVEKALADTEK